MKLEWEVGWHHVGGYDMKDLVIDGVVDPSYFIVRRPNHGYIGLTGKGGYRRFTALSDAQVWVEAQYMLEAI